MIKITLPNQDTKIFDNNITGFDIAKSISISLAKEALIIEIDGKLRDLSHIIDRDCSIRILTNKSPEILEILRHDAAHIMAQAVKELYPNTQVTIGPAIESGFYYDFAREQPFTLEDLERIEEKMREIISNDDKIIREVWGRNEAIEFFRSIGEEYKAEIITSIPENDELTLYRQGNFIDLCRGPHLPSTGRLKYFKLMKVAGAYWRGDSKNEMLQRIYGTAFATQEALDQYLHMIEEAEKRDHRKLGRELELFHLQEEAQGMPFWHTKGWTIYQLIEKYIRNKLQQNNYIEVKTPILLSKSLWEKSGHWEKFGENMFTLQDEDKTLAIKPMNCPCHVQIFNHSLKSYRDLPLRMAEFGSCHRNETSGSLHGLLRVRQFVQDDAHIFCTEEQITSETISFCNLLTNIYRDFGFTNFSVKFSDRPALRAGSDEVWDKAENALKIATKEAGLEYILNPGEGAFYGPKLEFVLKDALGRDWQLGTLQVDFVLPARLDASYISSSGEKKTPVMLHRAVIGAFERFIGILIEEYAGSFPLWLAPIQVAVINITNSFDNYARNVHNFLIQAGIRSTLDISAEKVNYKISQFSRQKIPIIAVVGGREEESGTVSIRQLGSSDNKILTLDELKKLITTENEKYF